LNAIKIITAAILLLIPVLLWASPFLVCDPMAEVEEFEIVGLGKEPIITPAFVRQDGQKELRYDLQSLPPGSYTVKVRALVGLWGSDYSDPLDFSKPALPKPSVGRLER
jgi:hypothetical protein